MKTVALASKKESLLALSKEQLVDQVLKSERELSVQYDLLKETFLQNKKLQEKCLDLEKQLSQTLSDGYSDGFSWVSKIVFALKNENRPLRSSDLISILERKEPALKNHMDKAKFFSVYLNTAVRYQRITRQKVNGVRGYYYLLPEWIDDNECVISDYKKMMI